MSRIFSKESRKKIDWLKDAKCAQLDLSYQARMQIFFPNERGDYSTAKKICASCSVRKECLEAELKFPSGDQHGIFGGVTAKTRRKMIHERSKADRFAANRSD